MNAALADDAVAPQAAGAQGPSTTGQAAARTATAARRELWIVIAAVAVGAGTVMLAAAQPWARVSFAPAPPLPASHVTVTGHQLAPAAGALALAALACVAAIIATQGLARRAAGALLAAAGAAIAVSAATSAAHGRVVAVAAGHALGPAGAPRLELAAFPWWAAATAGGVAIVAAGLFTAWRGTRWPGMSSRYERPGGRPRGADDPAATWDALDRGADPTVRRGGT